MVEMMDKITVIVPVYNGRAHITDCLTSIWKQTYDNLEVLVYDDGSTDDSYAAIQEFLENQKSSNEHIVARFLQQENQGVACTRNRGIEEATGEYIVFVDQDDRLAVDYCETYLKIARNREADIVVGGYTRMTVEGDNRKVVNLTDGEWSKFVVMAPWAHIYRTSFLRENEIRFLSYTLGEDVYFNMLAYSHTRSVVTTGYNGYIWTNNPASVSNSKQNCIRKSVDPLFLLERIYVNLPEKNCIGEDAVEYFFMRYLVWYFFFTVRNSKWRDVAIQYDRAMNWLKERYPAFYKNHYIHIWKRKGELISIATACDMWRFLYRIGLLKPCLCLLAKKD